MERQEIEALISKLDTALIIDGEGDDHILEQLEAVYRDHREIFCDLVGELLDKPIGQYLEGYFEISGESGVSYW